MTYWLTDDCLNDSLMAVWIFDQWVTELMTDQPINQVPDYVGEQPLNGLITNWLTVWVTDEQPMVLLINWLTDWWLSEWFISDCLNIWMVSDWVYDWPTDLLCGWLARQWSHWITDWLTGDCLNDSLVTVWIFDWVNDLTTDKPTNWLCGWETS